MLDLSKQAVQLTAITSEVLGPGAIDTQHQEIQILLRTTHWCDAEAKQLQLWLFDTHDSPQLPTSYASWLKEYTNRDSYLLRGANRMLVKWNLLNRIIASPRFRHICPISRKCYYFGIPGIFRFDIIQNLLLVQSYENGSVVLPFLLSGRNDWTWI